MPLLIDQSDTKDDNQLGFLFFLGGVPWQSILLYSVYSS
jgi:hypothetical protein